MPSKLSSSVAGVVSFSPLSAMRPSAIMRSISRREATPARASNFAMRCGPVSRGCAGAGRGRDPRLRGTALRFVRCGGVVIQWFLGFENEMLFGKRKQVVKRILIVEDEPLTAFDNENILGDAGYEVVATVDDLDEALAALEREEIDLVLTDVRLRKQQTGIQLARAAKKKGVP